MKKLFIHSFKSPIGVIRLAATEKGLAAVSLPGESRSHFERQVERDFAGYEKGKGGRINKRAESQLRRYLGGKLRKFELPLELTGTPFQKKVLRRVQRIPFGATATYGEIARAVGHPQASRAVGGANGRNRLPLVIPCHRVVASSGLGGYGGGLTLKKRLLKLEGVL